MIRWTEIQEINKIVTSMIKDNSYCIICDDTLDEVHVLPGCQHRACRECIEHCFPFIGNRCPICLTTIPQHMQVQKDCKYDIMVQGYIKIQKLLEQGQNSGQHEDNAIQLQSERDLQRDAQSKEELEDECARAQIFMSSKRRFRTCQYSRNEVFHKLSDSHNAKTKHTKHQVEEEKGELSKNGEDDLLQIDQNKDINVRRLQTHRKSIDNHEVNTNLIDKEVQRKSPTEEKTQVEENELILDQNKEPYSHEESLKALKEVVHSNSQEIENLKSVIQELQKGRRVEVEKVVFLSERINSLRTEIGIHHGNEQKHSEMKEKSADKDNFKLPKDNEDPMGELEYQIVPTAVETHDHNDIGDEEGSPTAHNNCHVLNVASGLIHQVHEELEIAPGKRYRNHEGTLLSSKKSRTNSIPILKNDTRVASPTSASPQPHLDLEP